MQSSSVGWLFIASFENLLLFANDTLKRARIREMLSVSGVVNVSPWDYLLNINVNIIIISHFCLRCHRFNEWLTNYELCSVWMMMMMMWPHGNLKVITNLHFDELLFDYIPNNVEGCTCIIAVFFSYFWWIFHNFGISFREFLDSFVHFKTKSRNCQMSQLWPQNNQLAIVCHGVVFSLAYSINVSFGG